MRVRLLGPIEASLDGRTIPLGPPKQRAVLAMLALAPNTTVPVDRLIEGLWGEDSPGSAAKMVQHYVSRLRRAVAGADAEILTRGRGYELRLDPDQVDAVAFERLVRDGRAADALSLWAGAPLSDAADEPFASPEIRKLEQLHVAATELTIDEDLRAGRHGELSGRLEALVAEHPLRERLHAQLALTLYRSGRQADALAALRHARTVLVEQVGVEPGPELRDLHDAVLRQDPALQPAPRPPVRTNLPRATVLIGRETDLAQLTRLCDAGAEGVVTLVGSGGTGKTQLAVLAGHAMLEAFPDGVFFVALEAVSDAGGVPNAIARSLGLLDETDRPAQVRLVEHLRGRRLLLVLDNFEHVLDAAPGLAALTAGSQVRVLVTSQAPLRVRGERVVHLAPLALPAPGLALAALARVPSVALLVERAAAMSPDFALTDANAPAAVELCTLLDGVPLAIELAAARLSFLEPAELLARVAEGLDALGSGGRDLPPRQRGLRATLDWTARMLKVADRRLLGRLATFEGGFSVNLAEAIGDGDVLTGLAALADVSLVRRGRDGRLVMPPPVRVYARDTMREAGIEQDARRRHAHAVLAVLEQQAQRWLSEYAAWLADLELEAENIRAALRWAAIHDRELHRRLFVATAWWLSFSGRGAELTLDADLALAVPADKRERARVLSAVSIMGYEANALELLLAAADAWRALGDSLDLVQSLYHLSNAHAIVGETPAAFVTAEETQAVAVRLGDPLHVELAEVAVAQALSLNGRPQQAQIMARSLMARARPGTFTLFASATTLGDAALQAREPAEALAGFAVALGELRAHHPRNIAFQLDGIAMALAALERDEDALLAAAVGDLVRREFSTGLAKVTLAPRDHALAPLRARAAAHVEQAAADRAAALGIADGLAWAVTLGGS
jgi:predicted ATPase/DNA-binding SARP family transcriptional activator